MARNIKIFLSRKGYKGNVCYRSGPETRCRSLQREIEVLTYGTKFYICHANLPFCRARCRDLDTDVTLNISSTQVFLTNEKLGSGAYAGTKESSLDKYFI